MDYKQHEVQSIFEHKKAGISLALCEANLREKFAEEIKTVACTLNEATQCFQQKQAFIVVVHHANGTVHKNLFTRAKTAMQKNSFNVKNQRLQLPNKNTCQPNPEGCTMDNLAVLQVAV